MLQSLDNIKTITLEYMRHKVLLHGGMQNEAVIMKRKYFNIFEHKMAPKMFKYIKQNRPDSKIF
jgi:hypothetical protein